MNDCVYSLYLYLLKHDWVGKVQPTYYNGQWRLFLYNKWTTLVPCVVLLYQRRYSTILSKLGVNSAL